MRKAILLLILIIVVPNSLAQKQKMESFHFSATNLNQVLIEIENKFDVKYSFVDSIVKFKKVSLPLKKYDLNQLNEAISFQTSLNIVKINNRYYSIYKKEDVIQTEHLDEIIIEGFLSKGIKKINQNIIITPQKVGVLPGVTDSDVLLALQQLPGVKSPNETATGLYIRGGTSDQNLVLWDGIRMYHPGHLFGMISGFNPNAVQSTTFHNKATNPKFGERISSTIEIKMSDSISNKLNINAGLNGLNADIFLQTPIYKNKLGVILSFRKSYTEIGQTMTFNSLAEKVFQNTNFSKFNSENQFQFYDFSAKLIYNLHRNTQISLTTVVIDNGLNYKSDNANLEVKNQKMKIFNSGFGLNWNQKYSSKLTQNALIYYSAYTLDYEKNRVFPNTEFEQFNKLNRVTDSGVELNFVYAFSDILKLDFGSQLSGNDISHSFVSKNQDIQIALDQKHFYNISQSNYAFLKYNLPKWNIQVGARNNYYLQLKRNNLEPRIFIQNKINTHFTGQISFEKKSQIVSQVRESVINDLSLENYVWLLSDNSNYPIQNGNQYTLGFTYKKNSWLLDIDTYYKTIDGITSLTFGFLNPTDLEVHKGTGFTKGVDILIQKSGISWKAWLTYTYQDSQNKYDGVNGNNYFPVNSDITHSFSSSFHKTWGNYSFALGWFLHTGKPYSLLNSTNQVKSFNTERLPIYNRLDISGDYQFYNKKTFAAKVGFSIFNVYNQHSILSKEYEKIYTDLNSSSTSNYKTQDYYSLGFTPNLFLRFNF